jgi:peptidoglycan/xylan/chitin deacetylase (PgdA/CDA1 family)
VAIAKRDVAGYLLEATGLHLVLRRLKAWRGVLTLNYHRIGYPGESPFDPDLYSATAENFDKQIRFLQSWCDIIVPDALDAVSRGGRGRYALITFDDGYIDNYTVALPVLKARQARATFFLATGLLDRPRVPWWDEIAWMLRIDRAITIPRGDWLARPVAIVPHDTNPARVQLREAYGQLPQSQRESYLDFLGAVTGRGRATEQIARDLWMSWDMVRELHAAKMVLGGHTHEHVMLSEQPPERQRQELETCLGRIEQETGVRPDAISYPYGSRVSFDAATRACLSQVDVRYAFSYYGGYRTFEDWDPFDIRRIAVETYLSAPQFRSKVACPRLFA